MHRVPQAPCIGMCQPVKVTSKEMHLCIGGLHTARMNTRTHVHTLSPNAHMNTYVHTCCIVTVHNSTLIHARHLVHKHNTVEFNNLPPNTVCARPPMCTCAYARSLPALSWRVPTASGL